MLNLEEYTRRLIAETLFYDEEYGALGNLSLIDERAAREAFVAAYSPEDGVFVIEEATQWEDFPPEEDDEIGYALAVDSKEVGSFPTPFAAADELLRIAVARNLYPSITLLFEEDEVT